MSYELIITEKPQAAKKIAESLADSKPIRKSSKEKVPYYELTHKNKKILVVSAVGHVYGLDQSKGIPKSNYPVFDISWVPSSGLNKASSFTKKYLSTIKRLSKDANEFTVATDYDIEGEVIGLNVVRYACKQKDANRMKFSTLTKDDLIKAYENKSKTLDWPQANAGETRHKMDWFFGINLSRALTASVKAVKRFKLMSTGRVQGPALKLIVDKEKEIKAFVPEPYWQIQLDGKINSADIVALHELDKIFDKKKAELIYEKCRNEKTSEVNSVDKKRFKSEPPKPFDLTSLQVESHKCLNISPKHTLEIAQELYTKGYTSYPRTSSQQLPKEIGYNKILEKLSKQSNYKNEVSFLLAKKNLVPNNGTKKDPAHPAIYPTGIVPKFKDDRERKVYDLIVRRFLATFGDPAVRETMTVKILCKDETFVTKGTTTIEKGWFDLYKNYVTLKEEELPKINSGDLCNVIKIKKLDKKTNPPNRYTESSIIKALEKENLGTKATRASIVETLYDRGFIDGKSIIATELGIRTEETLEKYSHKIVDPELTRKFEEDMEEIREKKKTPEEVLDGAKKEVQDIIFLFEKNLEKIGKELVEANDETRNVMTYIGKCPNCDNGELHIRNGKFGHFIACNNYPECKTIYSLPKAKVRPAKEECKACGLPMVLIMKKSKAPQKVCIDPKCPAKMENHTEEDIKEIEDISNGKVEKECPKCKEGKLVVRKSIYGAFLGCNKYPKCRYTEKINGNGNIF